MKVNARMVRIGQINADQTRPFWLICDDPLHPHHPRIYSSYFSKVF